MKIFLVSFLFSLISQLGLAQNPVIKVLDTDFSKGRLTHQQTISLNDAAKLHGHLCDGLVLGFIGLREALYILYPDSIIDRTNTRVVSKSSPCLTDIGILLTGGRYQFNTFYVSDSIHYAFIVQRIDDGRACGVKLKPGIKPGAIDSLGSLANKGLLDACDIDALHTLENEFSQQLLDANPQDVFSIQMIPNFIWQPVLQNTFIKSDVLNKQKQNCR